MTLSSQAPNEQLRTLPRVLLWLHRGASDASRLPQSPTQPGRAADTSAGRPAEPPAGLLTPCRGSADPSSHPTNLLRADTLLPPPPGEAEPAKPRSSLRHAPPRPLTRPAAAGGLLPVLPWPLRAAGCSCGRCWRCWRCWQLPGPRSTEPSITPGRSAEMGPSCAPRRLVQREQVRGRR